jgi:Pin2-interacting protein X1
LDFVDAARFGQAYLEKLGWSSGSGLGASGDGRTSHLAVKQKLNMLGIGADAAGMNGDPTIAWKQGKDFDSVLARLNASRPESAENGDESGESSRKRKTEDANDGDRRRKKSRSEDAPVETNEARDVKTSDKAQRKEEKRRRKEEKRAAAAEAQTSSTDVSQPLEDVSSATSGTAEPNPTTPKSNIPRHRA